MLGTHANFPMDPQEVPEEELLEKFKTVFALPPYTILAIFD